MAKSLRSKRKRKLRAVKRERYGKKEMERLKKTLGLEKDNDPSSNVQMEISAIANVVTAREVMNNEGKTNEEEKFNKKTLRNEKGAYPVWLHPRKIKKSKNNKGKKKRGSKRQNYKQSQLKKRELLNG